ncbi:MAG TPA: hypothetical protein VH394_12460 [Thermoanaerobaculia bacterium]|nr:hypothetical protein [Thermoanaerobaculia bacterium]
MSTALIVSFVVGVLGSLAAAFLFPSLQIGVTAALIRLLGWLPIRRQASFDGLWKATWHVDSPKYPSQVMDENVRVRQLGNRVYAKFRAEKLACHLMGTIEDRYITGTWYDEVKGGYHGAFQLIADISDRNHLSGLWIGYSTSGIVKSGAWEWERRSE